MSDPDKPAMSREELDRLFNTPQGMVHDKTPAAPAPSSPSSPPEPAGQGGRHRSDHHSPPRPSSPTRGDLHQVTSDLTIDETLLLHSIDWEPVDMVIGASVAAIPTMGFAGAGWAGATDQSAQAFTSAVASAVARIRDDCSAAGGVGVIGVDVDFQVHRHTVQAVLVGTAVRPAGGGRGGHPFVSDLTVRDFLLLHNAGWEPLGLAFGASFVQVPYRTIGTVFKQVTANTEMTNLTEAMYQAREQGMERLQSSAIGMGAQGVVAVQYSDRPLPFASHVIGFTSWGTAIRLSGESHRYVKPRMVVAMDDAGDLFDLQGAMGTKE
ncbi:heavy metal-binding domain-containing protein [Acidiferrimicrobium sp. IK]|uniref:heavy metal-binding domain-containing protein n=1 Tax=Acidiferrimicrobium sp. IK TaxID=2871700 RepID=UPI0021CB47C7|nr:heavy metal-binding domain-containing protein [Acidiferrimicrobium sp. IK]MCU4187095.1 heavy metal-binding domain-containing protein [Acidiferrimicrobium sp. IK]